MTPLLALVLSVTIPHSFVTDFCTGYNEGTARNPRLWQDCCVEHDLHYWAGGTKKMRHEADIRLQECVEQTGARTQAKIMYAGVQLGHLSPMKDPRIQWGNAWEMGEDFRPLTRDEVDAIEADLPYYSDWLPQEMSARLVETLEHSLDESGR